MYVFLLDCTLNIRKIVEGLLSNHKSARKRQKDGSLNLLAILREGMGGDNRAFTVVMQIWQGGPCGRSPWIIENSEIPVYTIN